MKSEGAGTGQPQLVHVLEGVVRRAVMWVFTACCLMGVASPSIAQITQFEYELRIRSLDPSLANGGGIQVPSSGRTLNFVVEGRARAISLAPGNVNYGVGRLTVGPAGSSAPSQIRVIDNALATVLRRGVVNPSGPGGFPLTGRARLFRSGGPVGDSQASPWHSVDQNGPQGGLFPSGANNQFGAFDLDGDRIYGFDAYLGSSRTGETNPWLGDFPISAVGQFSLWRELYFFDVVVAPTITPRSVIIQAGGYMSAAIRAQDIGGGTWIMGLTAAQPGSGVANAPNFVFTAGQADLPPVTFSTIRTGTFAPPAGNGSQYTLVRASRPISWFEARDYAATRGGLAVVASASENSYIISNLLTDSGDGQGLGLPWLGGSRLVEQLASQFSWLNGEPFAFSDWLPGQPNVPIASSAGIAYGQSSSTGPVGWVDEDAFNGQVRDLLIEVNPCINPGRIVSQTIDTGIIYGSGSEVLLTVNAINVRGYQWRRNGVPVPGASFSTYSFLASQSTVGTYDCLIQDDCSGLVSAPVDIRICSNIVQPYSVRMGERARFGVATDPVTGRVLMYGGESSSSPRSVLGDTITQSTNPGWTLLNPNPAMPARSEHAMSDSPLGPLVFGGRDQTGTVLGDAWRWTSSDWAPLAFPPQTPVPAARSSAVLAYNERTAQAVLFGGRGADGQALGDTWIFTAAGWQLIPIPAGQGPSARWNHAMVYDPTLQGIVLFGGRSETGLLADTWLLQNGQWTPIAAVGPTAREEMTLHRDTRDQSIRMLGGRSADGTLLTSEWRLDSSGWTRLTPSYMYGPMAGHRAISTFVGQMFVGGGYVQAQADKPVARSYAGPTNATIGSQGATSVGFDIAGAPIELTVSATGSITQIRWTRNNVLVVDGTTAHGSIISGAQTRRLRIENPRLEDAGSYIVTVSGNCVSATSRPYIVSPRCGPADVGIPGGEEGSDQRLDNNDFVVFVRWFFDGDDRADVASEGAVAGSDGTLDTNDFVLFIQRFFAGCD